MAIVHVNPSRRRPRWIISFSLGGWQPYRIQHHRGPTFWPVAASTRLFAASRRTRSGGGKDAGSNCRSFTLPLCRRLRSILAYRLPSTVRCRSRGVHDLHSSAVSYLRRTGSGATTTGLSALDRGSPNDSGVCGRATGNDGADRSRP
jgi:hypothetical protein